MGAQQLFELRPAGNDAVSSEVTRANRSWHLGPFRFFFYSFDCNEPRHVHVRRDKAVRKFWLEPVVLAYNNGFSAKDLNRIRKITLDNLQRIREAWDEHCGE